MTETIVPFNQLESNEKCDSIEVKKLFEARSIEPTKPGHTAYLKAKGLEASDVPGVLFGEYCEAPSLLIPIKNIDGTVQSIQYIYQDQKGQTQKRFLKDADKSESFFALDDLVGCDQIFITEGVATAASLRKLLKHRGGDQNIGVVCAFTALDIPKVAAILKEAFDCAEIIAAPDHDSAGNLAAKKCKEMGLGIIFPPKIEGLKGGADWNDVCGEMGFEKALAELETALIFGKEADKKGGEELETILEKIDEDPCRRLSMENFPPILRTYVESLCETTEAHPIMIIMSVLCSISAMVGKKVYMPRGEYFQNLYPNIWSLCITKSGGFKTTALNKGSEIALEEDGKTLQTMKDIQARDTEYNPLDDRSKLDSKLAAEVLKESLKRPLLPTRVTSEFLIKHLSQGHKGMILSSEMGEWLGNLEKNHNVDLKQIFTYFYDVDIAPYESRTKHCGGGIVQKPFITINGVSTVDWLQKKVKADDVFSGFFARMLLFAPPFETKIPDARPKKKEVSVEGIEAKRKIVETLEHLGEIQFSFTEETAAQFDSIHAALYQMARNSNYDERCQMFLEPYLKRWSPYILKLAMLFRIIEDPTSKELSLSSIKAATEIISVAIKSTAKLFEKELGESENQRKQRRVYEWVVKRCKDKKSAHYFSLIKSKILDGGSKEYDEVLETLEVAAKIECSNPNTENKKDRGYVPFP
jgi:hypothetical protein